MLLIKKLVLFLCCLTLAYSLFGQEFSIPQKGSKAFMLGITGLNTISLNTNPSRTGTLLFKYYTNKNTALRFGLGLSLQNTTSIANNNPGTTIESTQKNNGLSLSFGCQKKLNRFEKLETYIAGDIFIAMNRASSANTTTITDSSKTANIFDTNQDWNKDENRGGLNTTIGLTGSIGFNYYIKPYFSLGGEIGYGLNFSQTGHGAIINSGYTARNGGNSYSEIQTKSRTANSLKGAGSTITLTFFF
jgi:hypothetical protein